MNQARNKICIIFNPTAKGERARKWHEELKRSLPDAELLLTQGSGDAEQFARAAVARGCDCIVAAGGDGTINEVVNGMAGSDAALGIIPLGTMNVFSLELGIPQQLSDAVEIIKNGQVRTIDLAQVTHGTTPQTRYFVQLAGVGFDAEAVRATNFQVKKMVGPLSYVLAAVQVAAKEAPTLMVKGDANQEEQGSFVLIGNGRYYGGPFEFFPEAKLDDGLLDVCVFKRRSHMDLIHYFQGILCGTHTKFEDIEYFRTAKVTVSADRESPMEVDGEFAGMTPVEFAISGKSLRVLVR
jgi:diacylglycerol kinase (ATP)